MKKISIIIPTLNEEKIISKTLSSLQAQLKLPYEIIVSDGKSTDNTVILARKHIDKVISYSGQTRQTIAEGRNAGADIAEGEFLVFLDADCTIPEPDTFFSKALENFAQERVVAVTGWLNVTPLEATIADNIVFSVQNVIVFIINNILHGGTAPGGEFQMIRADVFRKIGGYNGGLVASEDIDLFSRLARVGRVKMDRRLKIYHSGRRGHKIGWIKLLSLWFLNSIWMMTTGKAFVKEWKPIR